MGYTKGQVGEGNVRLISSSQTLDKYPPQKKRVRERERRQVLTLRIHMFKLCVTPAIGHHGDRKLEFIGCD